MNALSLNYQVIGNGPPVLLIHGYGISFNIWKEIVPFLCPYFSLVIIELPGIGHSPMPDMGEHYLEQAVNGLENIRRSLGIERWQIFAYSYGIFVAKRYVQMYPAGINGLVFLCPVQISSLKVFILQFTFVIDKKIQGFGSWILSGRRLKFLIDLLGFNFKKNNLSMEWFNEISSQPMEILKGSLQNLVLKKGMSFNIPSDLPTCFIWGNEDLLARPSSRLFTSRDHLITATHSAPQTAARQISEFALPFLLSNCKI